MIRKILLITICASLMLTACGNKEVADNEENEKEIVQSSEKFTFHDVFNNEYTITIEEGAARCTFDKELFELDGQYMTYNDESLDAMIGVDVSYYQGDIDWEKVAGQGIEFAFIRAGYRGYEQGTLNVDDKFKENLSGALKAGIDTGVYFFSQAISEEEAVEEAEFVLDMIEGFNITMPIVYDPETIQDAKARTDEVTKEQFTANAAAFCERIKEAGYEPMIYANMLWEAYQLDMKQLASYDFWYADYEDMPQSPYDYDIWQYTSEGKIDGIDAAVDLNIYLK